MRHPLLITQSRVVVENYLKNNLEITKKGFKFVVESMFNY